MTSPGRAALLRELGKFVMEHLRDRALSHAERTLAGQWAAPATQRLQSELAQLSPEQRALVFRVVRASVDSAIHDFLFALTELERANSVAMTVQGVDATTLSDGVYAEQGGADGWQASYSRYGEAPEED